MAARSGTRDAFALLTVIQAGLAAVVAIAVRGLREPSVQTATAPAPVERVAVAEADR
ncbi:MAG TPA: hypothetical protein VFP72_14385 [Kineosporiaceae bacterium]|nr:hypothetical protein [Kineosporiaceae bacterium]